MEYKRTRISDRRGQVMILGVLLIATIMGMSAIAFDLGYMYVVKSRLMTSVDAAALAGIRELPEGDAATRAAVTRTFEGNFPAGLMMTKSRGLKTVDIQSVGGAQRLRIVGEAAAPLFFARWFGRDTTTIRAEAETLRRARNVILVLDYSDSLRADLPAVKQAAIDFVGTFDPQLDQVGLVTFSNMAGIDYEPQTNFVTGMTDAINAIETDFYTNSGGGLYWAYRALKDLDDPLKDKKLNAIVFFTDGVATAFPGGAVLKTGPGRCSIPEAEGMFVQTGSLGNLLNLDAPPHPVQVNSLRWAQRPRVAGCEDVDVRVVVESIRETWYPEGGYLAGGVSIRRPGGYPWPTSPPDPRWWSTLINAFSSATFLNLADAIRTDKDLDVTINAIGFGGANSGDLNQVANTSASATYDASSPEGMYVYADDQAALKEAFRAVASSLGRLVK